MASFDELFDKPRYGRGIAPIIGRYPELTPPGLKR